MQFSRLVLPAPFGPMMALRAPGSTEKLTSWRAVTPPKRRTRWEMSRRGEDIRRKTTCLLYRGESDRGPVALRDRSTENPKPRRRGLDSRCYGRASGAPCGPGHPETRTRGVGLAGRGVQVTLTAEAGTARLGLA